MHLSLRLYASIVEIEEDKLKMKIVVTGANGFIGSWVIKMLADGRHEIICLVREGSDISRVKNLEHLPGVKICMIDYENEISLESAIEGVSVLIHLIGQMGGKEITKEKMNYVNVTLTERVANVCVTNHVNQIIYCSTPGVQGFGHRACAEDMPYAPRGNYERSKMEAEKTLIEICRNHQVNYTIIRPDFVYGPFDMRRIKMYKNIKNKKFVLTTKGDSYLHPTYVEDVAQGIVKAVQNKQAYNEIFNISAAKDVTSLQYLQTIAECVGCKLIHINIGYHISIFLAQMIEKVFIVLKKEPPVTKSKIDFLALDHSTSIKKAQRLLNYKPKYSLRKGMECTISWCQENNLL